MNPLRPICALVCLLGLALAPALAAEGAQQLQPGQTVEREIAAGDTHEFEVELKANRFLVLQVEQHEFDVVVRVYGPDGEKITEVDSQGKTGMEVVTLRNRAKGIHRIEVASFAEDAEPGGYAIEIVRLEKVARSPSGKVDQLMVPWNRLDSPGAAVAVVRGGKVIFKKGYGSAQLEYEIPITPSTIFHVASVSKQFTAFAVTLLAEQGKLSLDDDIRKHIPEVPDFGKTITLRHLIHHTSGLRDQWNLLALAGWRLDDVITLDHIMGLVSRQREVNFDPGEEHVYCNTGYTLLAETVARVSEQSFREWTTKHMFQPLGMTRTAFHDDHERIVPGRAYSYSPDDDAGFKKSVLSYANVGATSLFTTVEDLALWSNNFDTAQLGGKAVIEQMLQRGVLNDGTEIGYAFGLGHGEHRGLRTVSHSGGDAGFRSRLARYPDQDFAVVVLSNAGNFNPGGIAAQIAGFYLEDKMIAAEKSKAADQPEAEEDPPATETATAEAAPLDDYVGDYQIEGGILVAVTRDGDKLMGQVPGQPKVELAAKGDDAFSIAVINGRVVFRRNEDGAVEGLTFFQAGQERAGKRVERSDLGADELARYAGRYFSPELDTAYTLIIKEEKLVATHVRHGEIELSPTIADEFTGDRWFFGSVVFERDADDRPAVMLVSSGRVRSVRFERRAD